VNTHSCETLNDTPKSIQPTLSYLKKVVGVFVESKQEKQPVQSPKTDGFSHN
jgi:hypothetical protein